MDFEEEEEEEEGNEEGWVLEPQEGVVGSMEGPDDSEVTFALHSGRSLRGSAINSVHVGIGTSDSCCVGSLWRDRELGKQRLALPWRSSHCEGLGRAWLLEPAGFKASSCSLAIYDLY